MKTLRLIAALSGLALLVPVAGMAQSPDDIKDMSPQERQEFLQSLSPEERQGLAQQRRAQWDAMTPEERDVARKEMRKLREENRAAMREHWESLSEEERAAARAERKAQWESMSDEERKAAMKKRQKKQAKQRKAMREHWDSLSEEERQAIRDRQREHRKAAPGGKGGPRENS